MVLWQVWISTCTLLGEVDLVPCHVLRLAVGFEGKLHVRSTISRAPPRTRWRLRRGALVLGLLGAYSGKLQLDKEILTRGCLLPERSS